MSNGKKKESGAGSAQEAAKEAERLRAMLAEREEVSTGTVLNGDTESWAYCHVPRDPMQKERVEAILERNGWSRCTGDEQMSGFPTGTLWRIPKVIKKEVREKRAAEERKLFL